MEDGESETMETNVKATGMKQERESGRKDMSRVFFHCFLCCQLQEHKTSLPRWNGKTINFCLRLYLFKPHCLHLKLVCIPVEKKQTVLYITSVFYFLWIILATCIITFFFSHSSSSSLGLTFFLHINVLPNFFSFPLLYFPLPLVNNKKKPENNLCIEDQGICTC